MMDRDTAWARLFDPATDAATLADIAQHYPEFAEGIARHPNCYDALRDWLTSASEAVHPTPVDGSWDEAPTIVIQESAPSASHIPPTAQPNQPGTAPDVPAAPAARAAGLRSVDAQPGRRGTSRRAKIIALAATAIVVVGGAGAWAAGTLLAGSGHPGTATDTGQSSALAVSGRPPALSPFASGAKVAWAVNPPDGAGDLVVGDKIWMVVAGDGTNGMTLSGVDARTGVDQWHQSTTDFVQCATTSIAGYAYCVLDSGGLNQRIAKISLADGSTQKTLPLAQSNPDTGVSRVVVLDGAIIVEQGEGDGGGAVAFVSKFPADLAAQEWNTTVPNPINSNAASTWPDLARVAGDSLALSDGFADIGIDFATGAIVETSGYGTSDVLADGTFVIDTGGSADAGMPAPTIQPGSHTLVQPGDRSLSVVDFSDSADPAPAPLFYAWKDDGTVSTNAYGIDGSTALWATPVTTVASPFLSNVYGAAAVGGLALVDTAGNVTSVDPKSGAIKWSASYVAPARTGAGADFTKPEPFYADANTLVVADVVGSGGSGGETDSSATSVPVLHGFDATTGRRLWDLENVRLVHAPGALGVPAIVEGPAGIGPLVGTASITATVPTAPGMPSCPVGMAPVSWSTFPDGYVLLCSGTSQYVVDVMIGNAAHTCSTLAFDAVGYTLGCGGGSTFRVVGGGALVQYVSGSSGWTQPATATWSTYEPSSTTNTGFGASPARLPVSCPAGSSALSLSTWDGGWLLVCGTDAVHATSFVYHTSGREVSGGAMTFQDGRYCGADAGGATVCAGATPALVSVTPQGGSTTQYSASANYFPSNGLGGVGKGIGAYGVQTPKAEAVDQVRYLTQILQKSEQGRTTVANLFANLLRCQVSSSDTAAAASVIANRGELLSALAATPVDKVDGGSRLVAELTKALSVSLDVDQQYQVAAGQISGGDCATGLATMKAVAPMGEQTNTLKQTFVDDWNAHIVTAYSGTPTFGISEF